MSLRVVFRLFGVLATSWIVSAPLVYGAPTLSMTKKEKILQLVSNPNSYPGASFSLEHDTTRKEILMVLSTSQIPSYAFRLYDDKTFQLKAERNFTDEGENRTLTVRINLKQRYLFWATKATINTFDWEKNTTNTEDLPKILGVTKEDISSASANYLPGEGSILLRVRLGQKQNYGTRYVKVKSDLSAPVLFGALPGKPMEEDDSMRFFEDGRAYYTRKDASDPESVTRIVLLRADGKFEQELKSKDGMKLAQVKIIDDKLVTVDYVGLHNGSRNYAINTYNSAGEPVDAGFRLSGVRATFAGNLIAAIAPGDEATFYRLDGTVVNTGKAFSGMFECLVNGRCRATGIGDGILYLGSSFMDLGDTYLILDAVNQASVKTLELPRLTSNTREGNIRPLRVGSSTYLLKMGATETHNLMTATDLVTLQESEPLKLDAGLSYPYGAFQDALAIRKSENSWIGVVVDVVGKTTTLDYSLVEISIK